MQLADMKEKKREIHSMKDVLKAGSRAVMKVVMKVRTKAGSRAGLMVFPKVVMKVE